MSLLPVHQTFLGSPSASRPEDVSTPYAFVGVPYGPPCEAWELFVCADAADHLRRYTHQRSYAKNPTHWNFDLNEPQFESGVPNITDLGNISEDVRNPDKIGQDISEVVTPLVKKGVVPILVGGMDSVPPLAIASFVGVEDINILQYDAHIDFRDEAYGRRDSFSSPMRRARELSCVSQVVHLGTRSIGSARREEVEATHKYGNRIITAWDVHEQGAQKLAESLDLSRRYVISLDCDGLDPTIAPAVNVPEPGGLDFVQAAIFIRHLARHNRIAGLIVTEMQPRKDADSVTALTITRLILNLVGLQRSPSR